MHPAEALALRQGKGRVLQSRSSNQDHAILRPGLLIRALPAYIGMESGDA